ncbi:MAG: carboxylating nicotinate-nucleotide diphosphorylase [Candidatus Omnitrophota bacterium]
MIIKAKTKQLILQALKEDIGAADITTDALISKKQSGKFIIIAKQPCVICGIALAEACFQALDNSVYFRPMVNDATAVESGKVIAHIEGSAKSILMAERTTLNFLGWLSGVSTLTNKFVEKVTPYSVDIMDTRKTIPTFRHLQKYAVKIGGGKNHRMGLYDQVLIKDNHIEVTSNGIKEALEKAKRYAPKGKKIEIEVKNLTELKEALNCNPDIIMLDNMKISDIKEAVKLRNSYRIKQQDIGFKTLIEVSGNITLENVADVAACGIERISIGALTHSAPAADFSLSVAEPFPRQARDG